MFLAVAVAVAAWSGVSRLRLYTTSSYAVAVGCVVLNLFLRVGASVGACEGLLLGLKLGI